MTEPVVEQPPVVEPRRDPRTTAEDVAELAAHLSAQSVVYQVNGGWAVDAHVGRQTREHGDVDVFLDERRLPETIGWLERRGYRTVADELPVRIELRRGDAVVDLHPMAVDEQGDGVQQGFDGERYLHPAAERTTRRIGDAEVVVATVPRLVELRSGYPTRDIDVHDLRLLEQLA